MRLCLWIINGLMRIKELFIGENVWGGWVLGFVFDRNKMIICKLGKGFFDVGE